MARDIIVLEGNVCEEEAPFRFLFLYRDFEAITDEAGSTVAPTPQRLFDDDAKALLQPAELVAMNNGELLVEEVHLRKHAGVVTRADLREWTIHLQDFYWLRRNRFLHINRNVYSLRGLVLDAREPGGGLAGEAL